MAYIYRQEARTNPPLEWYPGLSDHPNVPALSAQQSNAWRSQVVSANHCHYPQIPFFSPYSERIGVALARCAQIPPYDSVADPHRPITDIVPWKLHQNMFNGRPCCLYIDWPGYAHLNWKHRLDFKHSNTAPYTVGEMASQVAAIWRRFINECCDEFKGPGIRLGPLFVTLDDIQLHEIYSATGTTWRVETSVTLP